jgi:hypothetical protein
MNNDAREQLVNERRTGTFAEVQVPLERITSVHGFMLDLDPKLYTPGNPIFPPADDPAVFYQQIESALARHPLAGSAEVRMTGTGLHLIVWLQPPVELHTAAEQRRWEAIVRCAQSSLPADPSAPGITALTRPVGSTNTKNGARVEVLAQGKPAEPRAVEEFVRRLQKAPFREVALPLLGETRVSPCPVCRGEGSRLDVLDWAGMCYGCGKVTLAQLLNAAYASPGASGEAGPSECASKAGTGQAEATGTPSSKGKKKAGKGASRNKRKSAAGRTKAD